MRTLVFLLKLLLKILVAPVILTLTLFVGFVWGSSMFPVWCWGLSAW